MANEDLRAVELTQRAYSAMAGGRAEEATRLWSQLHAIAPDNPQALLHMGQMALRRGDALGALNFLERAAAAAPKDAVVHLNMAFAARKAGRSDREAIAYENALAVDPYCYPAMLGKGEIFDRMGKSRQAARFYKDALSIAPPPEQMPPELAEQFARARQAVETNSQSMGNYLDGRLQKLRSDYPDANVTRFNECVGAVLGQNKIYTAQPTLLHYPALPAIQFYDDAVFPWLSILEAATDTICEELSGVLQNDIAKFTPYVAYAKGTPVNQWGELNHSQRWSSYFLWEKGERIDAHCARCPETAALMERLPLASVPGFAPTVMFSVLSPHTHIPPHTGVTNTRLVVHLPLIVPGQCRFRVGNETRDVVKGKAWVFDDSIEHEAWNDSDETRIILIIDVWNPHLNDAERALVCELLDGMVDYYREDLSTQR